MVQLPNRQREQPVHPVHPVQTIHWARLCDIPDASFFTTLFVGVSGKHFFMGPVKCIGGQFDFRVRLRVRIMLWSCVY